MEAMEYLKIYQISLIICIICFYFVWLFVYCILLVVWCMLLVGVAADVVVGNSVNK